MTGLMTIDALEHKQYGGYRAICYHEVTEVRKSKDGKRTTLFFRDGGKITKLSRLIKSIGYESNV